MQFRRVSLALAATCALVAGSAAGVASAAPVTPCPDVHFIGAAGSGQRDGADLARYTGMGKVIFDTYGQLASDVVADGKTITAEAVDYPAAPVPLEGGIGDLLGFMGSVDAGAAATAAQYNAFTAQCPTTKVVLGGYSQGAMAIHRNLYALAGSPQLAAVLLIADGDRLPTDTTTQLGSAVGGPADKGLGIAQDHYILAHTNTAPLPPVIGSRTISVCNLRDPVCDYNSDTSTLSPAELAIHTGYTASQAGVPQLYQLVQAFPVPAPAPVPPPAPGA